MKKKNRIVNTSPSDQTALFTVMRVSAVSLAANAALSAFKLFAGVFAHSGAMISDAVHSASDVFSTVIVMIGAKISHKAADSEHPYGHERMECGAAIILASVLFVTGLSIGYSGVNTLLHAGEEPVSAPGMFALIAAIVSIVVKEAMYWYAKLAADQIGSAALLADAWHHRSDALSSVGALIGISGARLGLAILDPIASIVICVFILKAAYDIYKNAFNRMVDRSCDPATEEKLRGCALDTPGVLGIDLLHTRVFGNRIFVEMEIAADGNQTLWETHKIAESVHESIERQFPEVKHVMVHVNPK